MNRKSAVSVLPYLIALFLGALYFRTLSPGLTWAYDGADGGDFLAALATGGVPHPGGYPTYMLLASIFAKLPIGSLAFRINLFSCITMVLAVLLFYKLAQSLTDNRYIASLSSLVFGTFPLVWSQALITEVYALQVLFTVLILLFFLPKNPNALRDIFGGLIVGLAFGNHLTAVFLVPFVLINNQPRKSSGTNEEIGIYSWKTHLQQVLKRLAGLCLGLTVFLTIPIRAHNQSPVNWGNATDWKSFWWLISGEMYQGRLSHFSITYLLSGLQEWANFLLEQMGIWGLAMGLFGLVMLFQPSRLFFSTVWLAIIYSLFSILYFSPDSYVYLIPALMAFALWISIGINYLLEKLSSKTFMPKLLLMSLPLALILFRAILMIPEQDLSTDHTAEQYAQSVLTSLPDRAIVITKGDESLFSLWYFHYAYNLRQDVAIISSDLMTMPWYHQVLKYTYPDLLVPDVPLAEGIIKSNASRPICELRADLRSQLECSK